MVLATLIEKDLDQRDPNVSAILIFCALQKYCLFPFLASFINIQESEQRITSLVGPTQWILLIICYTSNKKQKRLCSICTPARALQSSNITHNITALLLDLNIEHLTFTPQLTVCIYILLLLLFLIRNCLFCTYFTDLQNSSNCCLTYIDLTLIVGILNSAQMLLL